MNPLPRTVVIVGAGFSGAAVAINLLRLSYWRPVRVVLVERAERMGRGAAYADRAFPYLLNVPAGRMSLNSGDPLEFLKFAQQTHPNVTEDDFLPRALYGEYIETALRDAEIGSPAHVQLHRIRGDVCSIQPTDGGATSVPAARAYRVELADGSTFVADDVVLALGNPSPANPPGTQALIDSPRYVSDPWAVRPEIQPGESVLVIGTGLTMADTIVAGSETTGGTVTFHAISRRGLVPPSQTAFRQAGCPDESAALLRAASCSARDLVRAVRKLTDDVQRRGGDWREAVTCVRTYAPAIWQRLSPRERQRFLRHARPYWEVHRHRLPQETLTKFSELARADKLSFHAGRLLSFEEVDRKIHVRWRPRGEDGVQLLVVDRVINCTGADYNPSRSLDPLMRSLLDQGLATADALGLGLRTSSYGALLDAHHRPATNLYYIGPMLRADHWECTAAQELRVHAERLAHHLSAPAVKYVAVPRRSQDPTQRASSLPHALTAHKSDQTPHPR